jgi:hypothetical protein
MKRIHWVVGAGSILAGVAVGVLLKSSGGTASVQVFNSTDTQTTVYVSFGADSAITSWSFCPVTSRLNCQFTLPAQGSINLPLEGKYLNATLSFNQEVACGVTKAELNLNNPSWFDILDISLVDGFSTKVSMTVSDTSGTHTLGPVVAEKGNEKAFGVYPYGCDICIEKQKPPCSIPTGKEGCKTGPDQYHPDVPCQYQGSIKGGGTAVTVTLLPSTSP